MDGVLKNSWIVENHTKYRIEYIISGSVWNECFNFLKIDTPFFKIDTFDDDFNCNHWTLTLMLNKWGSGFPSVNGNKYWNTRFNISIVYDDGIHQAKVKLLMPNGWYIPPKTPSDLIQLASLGTVKMAKNGNRYISIHKELPVSKSLVPLNTNEKTVTVHEIEYNEMKNELVQLRNKVQKYIYNAPLDADYKDLYLKEKEILSDTQKKLMKVEDTLYFIETKEAKKKDDSEYSIEELLTIVNNRIKEDVGDWKPNQVVPDYSNVINIEDYIKPKPDIDVEALNEKLENFMKEIEYEYA